MNQVLSSKWGQLRGLEVVSIALGSVTLPPEDAQMIKDAQQAAMMRDPSMAAAVLTGAQAEAMKAAASNSAGAMNGFMGMGMAMNAGGGNVQNLFAMGQQQMSGGQVQGQPAQMQQPAAQQSGGWTCSCGTVCTGNFCPECGSPKPSGTGEWVCSCGASNTGKFCQNCGKPFEAGSLRF